MCSRKFHQNKLDVFLHWCGKCGKVRESSLSGNLHRLRFAAKCCVFDCVECEWYDLLSYDAIKSRIAKKKTQNAVSVNPAYTFAHVFRQGACSYMYLFARKTAVLLRNRSKSLFSLCNIFVWHIFVTTTAHVNISPIQDLFPNMTPQNVHCGPHRDVRKLQFILFRPLCFLWYWRCSKLHL
jgi:hypothetical protein